MKVTHLDLFSGIGGFALAVRWLGGTTVGFCEIEEYPQRVLRKNFPGVPIHDDIRTLTGATVAGWGGCDLVTGGFPCQPFSLAGLRRGNEDDRALWPEMARVIDECRPTYVLAENVPGLITVALDETLTHLEALGYAARSVAVPAVATDALHIRERIWIMAHRNGERERQPTVPGNGVGLRTGDRGQDRTLTHSDEVGRRPGEFHVQAGQSDLAGSGGTTDNPHGIRRLRSHNEVRAGRDTVVGSGSDDRHASSMQRSAIEWDESNRNHEGHVHSPELAVRDGGRWTPEPPFRRMAHGVPHRVDRLRGLGNAIVPAVAYEVLRVMLADELALDATGSGAA